MVCQSLRHPRIMSLPNQKESFPGCLIRSIRPMSSNQGMYDLSLRRGGEHKPHTDYSIEQQREGKPWIW
ncbi:hypothetical protein KSX_15410 [Ktedonospora formicarum]|uniref:Uncharacterized protein n=1 Tax=Ktedonospora formicarum TaxID=2778364 RepID=A0A8J3MR81_9CHLR|nr:hypothetical protein KSX_15410 [Ktedonospora formicarum]